MNWKENIVVKIAGLLKINLVNTAYNARGINLINNMEKNGEKFFIKNILPTLIGSDKSKHIFDVGANKGDYAELLLETFRESSIHCFEPNTNLYNSLKNRFGQNVVLNESGLSSNIGENNLFVYQNDELTGHATLYKNVLEDIHQNKQIKEVNIKTTTLDDYCIKKDIHEIDFIKIDVEGHEYEVLLGGRNMMKKIKVIQFELNEMNIISRVFFKDFYDLLPDFEFYRMLPKGLFRLGDYTSNLEIFKIQNIVAVNKLFLNS